MMSTCPSADTSRGAPWLTGGNDGSSRVTNSLYHVMVSRIVDCRAAPRWLPTRHNEIELAQLPVQTRVWAF